MLVRKYCETIMQRLCSLLLLAALLAGCSTAPIRPDNLTDPQYGYAREYISWLIRTEMSRNNVTGLSIALVDDQRIVWAEGFGFADQANHIAATQDTIYRVGSITKLFTATAAMQLVEQGKLDIDQPLQRYLPEFSVRRHFTERSPVTPRSIMTHHSGLPSDLLKGMWTEKPEAYASLVGLTADEYAASPPGKVFAYSNLGISLLGVALERISGKDYAGLVTESLLQPLDMRHTTIAYGGERSDFGARAYSNGELVEETPLRDVPAGGMNSSVNDLSRFIRMIFADGRSGGNTIIKPETLAEMMRPQNSTVPLDCNFKIGLGWMLGGLGDIDIQNAGIVAHHSGATLYHRSMLLVLPEKKLGVVVLSNSGNAGPLVNRIATETLKLALESKSGIKQPERKKPESAEPLSDAAMKPYEGYYATSLGMIPVVPRSGYLRAELMGTPMRLVPRSGGWLGLEYRLFGLFPISLGELDYVTIKADTIDGSDIIKARIGEQEILVGQKVQPVPLPPAWLKLVGEYEPVNRGADAEMFRNLKVRTADGLLLVDYEIPLFHNGTLSYVLQPISDYEAVIAGLGRGMGDTVRVVTVDGREMIRYSGYLLRKKESLHP
jgi:CubicO group peptidase (beta-lactamase class C family)